MRNRHFLPATLLVVLLLTVGSLYSQWQAPSHFNRGEQSEIESAIRWNGFATRSELNTSRKEVEAGRADSLNRLRQEVITFQDSLIDRVETKITDLETSYDVQLDSIVESIDVNQEFSEKSVLYINRFWMLIAAALVFFMQAGFKVLEFGMVRKVHGNGIGMKNLIDWLVVCVGFYLVGFAFMFGPDPGFVIGFDMFMPDLHDFPIGPFTEQEMADKYVGKNGFEFYLYQLAFAATAATIVSGAMSERTALFPYLIISVFVSMIIYPIFGHWVWGNFHVSSNYAWLYELGFRDFAGSTVVHSIGAWIALAGIMVLGPRTGRFDSLWDLQQERYKPYSLGHSVLGVFILWFGWWGFNGGSTSLFPADEGALDVTEIIFKTNICGAFAGITAFVHSFYFDRKNTYMKLIGGVLGGLVAITACCDVVSASSAMIIGIMAGIIHNLGFDLLYRLKLDDPIGAIPVHGVCGVWGTLCVALFNQKIFDGALSFIGWLKLFGAQLAGVLVAFAFAFFVSFAFFKFLSRFGLRFTLTEEIEGPHIGEGYD